MIPLLLERRLDLAIADVTPPPPRLVEDPAILPMESSNILKSDSISRM